MSYEDEYATDHLHCARELLGLIDNLHGDELGQAADLERGASAHALVDIAQSFRTLNSDRSQWYREVLEVLTAAKDGDGSLRSEQPAAAPWCQVCEVPSIHDGSAAVELTKEQWTRHLESYYSELIPFGAGHEQALRMATGRTTKQFGPCPEES